MDQWTPIATLIIGYGAQWMFGFKNIPTALTWGVVVALAIVLYLMGCDCKPTWNSAFFISAGGWILLITQAIRGSAGMSKSVGAPPTNSL